MPIVEDMRERKFAVYEEGCPAENYGLTITAKSLKQARRILKQQSREVGFDITPLKIVALCSECETPLYRIAFEETGSISVKDDGTYSYDGQTSRTYICPKCGKAIGGYKLKGRYKKKWGFIPELENKPET